MRVRVITVSGKPHTHTALEHLGAHQPESGFGPNPTQNYCSLSLPFNIVLPSFCSSFSPFLLISVTLCVFAAASITIPLVLLSLFLLLIPPPPLSLSLSGTEGCGCPVGQA